MKLSALERIEEIKLNTAIDKERELIPEFKGDKVRENTILFVLPRVGGGYTPRLEELKTQPYAIVTDYEFSEDTGEVPIIRTDNVRRALASACKLHYLAESSNIEIIAVSGTNGKTTTATLIYNMLKESGIKVGMIGTGKIISNERILSDEYYSMTTPDPDVLYSSLAEMEKDGCRFAVMEASSHAIALDKLHGLSFKIGVFTNLSSEHLDFHRNMEDYFETKARLFEKCEKCIINIDDAYGKRLYERYRGKSQSVGIIDKGEIYATDISARSTSGIEFYYRTNRIIFRARSRLIGSFNVYNCMLGVAAVIAAGVRPCVARDALRAAKPPLGRMEIIHETPTVIIDYAHTPYALENLLLSLKRLVISGQKLICVIGCGGERDKGKRAKTGKTVTDYCDFSVITEDNSRGENPDEIFRDILAGIGERDNYTVIPKRAEAIRYALSMADANDTVAIIGKGHERYIIDKDGKRAFDERAIVMEYFSEQGIRDES